jgi:hypothetical protein
LVTDVIIDHEVTSLTELSALGYRGKTGDIYDFIPNEQMINSATVSDLIIGLSDNNIRLPDIPEEKLTKEFYHEAYDKGLIQASDIPFKFKFSSIWI